MATEAVTLGEWEDEGGASHYLLRVSRTISSRDATQRVHIAAMVNERVGCL
jgi:hypothetical protein